MSGQANQNPHPERIFVSCWLYIFGVLLMMVADAKKYYLLKERRHLMNYGLMKYTRNPNYLGEIMLYASFTNIVNMWQGWFIVGYVWTLYFSWRMLNKDYSMSRKVGWKEYCDQSWMLIPKINGSAIQSYIFYGFFVSFSYWVFTNGGIEATVHLVKSRRM